MKITLFFILMIMSNLTWAESNHRCSTAATQQAHRLLIFHAGADDRIAVDETVKALATISNPANKTQSFDVLEVWGFIYKAKYRIHLLYAQMPGDCLLMGQEILEYANL